MHCCPHLSHGWATRLRVAINSSLMGTRPISSIFSCLGRGRLLVQGGTFFGGCPGCLVRMRGAPVIDLLSLKWLRPMSGKWPRSGSLLFVTPAPTPGLWEKEGPVLGGC